MSIVKQIEQMQTYPNGKSEEFRGQLERARDASARMDGQHTDVKGIDRSGDLVPIPRPRIVRTLSEH